jgi:peroxin-6
LGFKVDTVEPVLQGYIKKELTRLVVLLAEDADPSHSVHLSASLPTSPQDEDDEADIEIDESFLAGSTAASSFSSFAPRASTGNGNATSPSRLRSLDPLVLEPLLASVSPVTDDVAVYLKTADLGRLGLLNSDWVRTLCLPSFPP